MSSQILTPLKPGQTIIPTVDTAAKPNPAPDADRDDIPFIDFKVGIIWLTANDTIHNYCYIRKNFTDQLVEVWNPPGRFYPASRIYGAEIDGSFYKAVKIAPSEYIFAQRVVSGPMDFYLYRKIPQTNGYVEMQSSDINNPGYTNHMIIEADGMRGKRETYGYFISVGADTSALIPVSGTDLGKFASDFLRNTPMAYKEAMKYSGKSFSKLKKQMVLGIMAVGLFGAMFMNSDSRWIFLAGFPLAAVVAGSNKPRTLHWDDLARIVNIYNSEIH